MNYKRLFNICFVLMLLSVTFIMPACAAPAKIDGVIDDDTFMGFERNHGYDASDDLTLQDGLDLASSLPLWALVIVVILIMVVCVLLMVAFVVLFHMLKGGKAALNDNPTKGAQGIRDSKHLVREYGAQIVEGTLVLGIILFVVSMSLGQ